jgi:hypothetical protein
VAYIFWALVALCAAVGVDWLFYFSTGERDKGHILGVVLVVGMCIALRSLKRGE